MKKYLIVLSSVLICAAILSSVLAGCGDVSYPIPEQTDGNTETSEPKDIDSEAASALASAKAGDVITFGKWEQDGEAGDEPISWLVLEQHVGKVFVLSEKILEYDYFIRGTDEQPYIPGLYKDSDVRTFLNSDFYDKAFSPDEKAMILTTKIKTGYKDEHYNELWYETEDNVFLLSRQEANKYVCAGKNVFGSPTVRVEAENPYGSNTISGVPGIEKAMSWWLRDMGSDSSKYAAYIYAAESQRSTYAENVWKRAGVRPAMWIVYNEADMKAYAKGEIEPKTDDALERSISGLKVGSVFNFGSFDQDPYTPNGYESLEWTVVDADENTFTIVANKTVVKMPFLVKPEGGYSAPVTWDNSDIRKYINSDDFIDWTFTPQEKAKLLVTHVVTGGNDFDSDGGPATDDLLFILDEAELDRYYPQNPGRGIASQRTWLRSPGSWEPEIAYVESDGSVGSYEPYESFYVRLAARIKR